MWNKLKKKILFFITRISHVFPCLEPYLYKIGRSYARRSKGEILIENWLKENNIKYKSEYLIKFPFIVKKKNFVFIDFYLPDYNLFIEYNGKQHYEYVPYFHSTYKDFELQRNRDNVVRNHCLENNIRLLEIPYTLKDHEVIKILNELISD